MMSDHAHWNHDGSGKSPIIWTTATFLVQMKEHRQVDGAPATVIIMTGKERHDGKAAIIAGALRAAKDGNRDELVKLLRGVKLRIDLEAPFDERWLAAEREYSTGNYRDARTLFAAIENDPQSQSAPPWQQFLSHHRRSFASLKLGDMGQAWDALGEAEQLLSGAPELAARKPTVDAMHAHLLEKVNDFDGALARFRIAHGDAIKFNDWGRAATTASDVARVLGVLGRGDDALVWLDKALDARKRQPDVLGELTIRFRRGMINAMLGRVDDALRAYGDVIAAARDDRMSDVLMDTLAQRADLFLRLRRFEEAERDRLRALDIATSRNIEEAIIFGSANLALLHLARGRLDDEGRARAEFDEALHRALGHESPPPFLLLQLTRDILSEPRLAPQYARMQTKLQEALKRLEAFAQPSLYFQTQRRGFRDDAARQLEFLLRKGQGQQVELASCAINVGSGTVKTRTGITRLNPAELKVLRMLLRCGGSGMTVAALEYKLPQRTAESIRRSLSRIRAAIDGDLLVMRDGNHRIYSLQLA